MFLGREVWIIHGRFQDLEINCAQTPFLLLPLILEPAFVQYCTKPSAELINAKYYRSFCALEIILIQHDSSDESCSWPLEIWHKSLQSLASQRFIGCAPILCFSATGLSLLRPQRHVPPNYASQDNITSWDRACTTLHSKIPSSTEQIVPQ